MKFIGANSLSRTIRATSGPARRRLESQCIAIPGLSANSYGKFKRKTVQHLLENTTLKFEKEIGIWHDVLNNSLSKHSSNFNRTLSAKQLIGSWRNIRKYVWFCFAHDTVRETSFSSCALLKYQLSTYWNILFPILKTRKLVWLKNITSFINQQARNWSPSL